MRVIPRVAACALVAVGLIACGSDAPSKPPPTTSAPTTTNFGTKMANSLLSWCILHEPRSYVRTQLEGMVAPNKVDLFLDQYDRLVDTGGCG